MEFKNKVIQLAERAQQLKYTLHTEEETKTALVLPMLWSLGYDVFNPTEVVSSYVIKGMKSDYTIFANGEPIIFVKCKHCKHELTSHDAHVLSRFQDSKIRIHLLTNGITYRFYIPNTPTQFTVQIDENPFLEINLDKVELCLIEHLKKFHKANFDINSIMNYASELRYRREFRSLVKRELNSPSPDFVELFARKVHSGVSNNINPELLERFSVYLRESISDYVNDIFSEKFKAAQKKKEDSEDDLCLSLKDQIKATPEEVEGYMIVLCILNECADIDTSRVVYRDAINYFSILVDGDETKPICRFVFNGREKYITIFDNEGNMVKHRIESLNDIYNYSVSIVGVGKNYMGKN